MSIDSLKGILTGDVTDTFTPRDPGVTTDQRYKYDQLAEVSAQKIRDIDAKAEAAQIKAKQDQMLRDELTRFSISDENLDTLPGQVVNTVLGAATGLPKLAGSVLTSPVKAYTIGANISVPEGSHELKKSIDVKKKRIEHLNATLARAEELDVSEEQRQRYRQEIDLQKAQVAYTPEEEALFLNTDPDNIYSTSIYDKLNNIQEIEKQIDSVEEVFNWASDNLVNRRDIDIAAEQGTEEFKDVATEFEKGNVVAGIGEFISGTGNVIADNPSAAVLTLAESLPHMFALAKNAAFSLPVAAETADKARDAFVKEHDRAPNAKETAIIAGSALAAAGLDLVGARVAFNPLKSKADRQAAALIKATKKSSKAAKRGATGTAIYSTGQVIKAAGTEGGTEALQTMLEQYAGKQDITKLEGGEVLTATALGASSGGGISVGVNAPSVAKKGAKATKETAKKVKEVASEKIQKDKVLQEAIETGDTSEVTDPVDKIKADISEKAVPEDYEDKVTHIGQVYSEVTEMASTLIEEIDTKVAKGEAIPEENERLSEVLQLVEQVKGLRKQTTVQPTELAEVVKRLASIKEPTAQTTEDVATVFGSHRVNPGSVSIEQAESILESPAITPEEKQELTDYIETRKDIGQVSREVFEGGAGFMGINEHQADINSAVRDGDQNLVAKKLGRLQAFGEKHKAKLKTMQEGWDAFISIKDGSPIPNAAQIVKDAEAKLSTEVDPATNKPIEFRFIKGKTEGAGTQKILKALPYEIAAINLAIKESQGVAKRELGKEVTPTEAKASVKETKPKAKSEVKFEPIIDAGLEEDTAKVEAEKEAPKSITTEEDRQSTITKAVDSELDLKNVDAGKAVTALSRLSAAIAKNTRLDTVTKINDYIADVKKGFNEASEVGFTAPETVTPAYTRGVALAETLGKLRTTEPEKPVSYSLAETLVSERITAPEFTTKSGEAVPSQNIKTMFKAVKDRVGNNYLQSIPNFFTALANTPDLIKGLTENQSHALNEIQKFNQYMTDALFRQFQLLDSKRLYKDMVQYFVVEGTDYTKSSPEYNKDVLEENLVSAINMVVLNWLATRSVDTLTNNADSIAKFLHLPKDSIPTPNQFDMLIDSGVHEATLAESLGKDIVRTLGITAKGSAKGEVEGNMEMSLGHLAIATMIEGGYVQKRSITAEDMEAITKDDNRIDDKNKYVAERRAETFFIRAMSEPDRYGNPVLHNGIRTWQELIRNSENMLEDVFGIEALTEYPTLDAPKPVTRKIKRSTQLAPKKVVEITNKHQNEPNTLKTNVFDIAEKLTKENLYDINDFETNHEAKNPKGLWKSIEGKNRAIIAEVDQLLDYVKGLPSKDTPFFIRHEIWKNMRIGMSGIINPQGKKFHRHLIGKATHEVEIDPNNTEELEAFYLAVAQSLGVSIDKLSKNDALKEFKEIIMHPAIVEGLNAIQELQGKDVADIPPNKLAQLQNAVVAATKAGGENTHSLDGLVNYAEYLKSDGKFKSNISIEVDGITNGITIGMIQLFAANDVPGMLKLLKRGGLYSGNTTSYAEWYSRVGSNDNYESMTIKWHERLQTYRDKVSVKKDTTELDKLNSLTVFVGEMLNPDGTVSKIGRSLSKDPSMVTSYGAGFLRVVNVFSDSIIDNIYKTIAENRNKPQELIKIGYNLDTILGKPIGTTHLSPNSFTQFELSNNDIRTLQKAVNDSYGAALKIAVKSEYGKFVEQRGKIDEALQLMFKGFKLRYEAEVERATEAKNGDLPTREEKRKILDQLLNSQPIFKSFFSRGRKDGILVMDKESERQRDSKFITQSQFAKKNDIYRIHQDGKIDAKPSRSYASTSNYSSLDAFIDGGAAGAALGIHAMDAAVMVLLEQTFNVLNVHDAAVFSLMDSKEGSIAFNKAFKRVMTEYSLVGEIYRSLKSTMKVLRSKEPELFKKLDEENTIRMPNGKRKPMPIVDYLAQWQRNSERTIKLKYEATNEIDYWSQYNLEGAGYSTQTNPDKLDSVEDATDKIVTELKSIPNKERPMTVRSVAVANAVEDGANLPELMETIIQEIENNPGGEATLAIAKRIQKYLTEDTKVIRVTDDNAHKHITSLFEGSLGAYNPITDTLYLRDSFDSSNGMRIETALHEMIHAAAIKELRKDTEHARKLRSDFYRLLVTVRKNVKADKLEDQFGPAIKDVDELIAWSLSNKSFQTYLRTITSNRNTVYSKFTETLRKLLRIPEDQRNVLSEIIEYTDRLLPDLDPAVNGTTFGSSRKYVSPNNFDEKHKTELDGSNMIQVYEDIKKLPNTVKDSVEHDGHLRGVLNMVINNVAQPLSIYRRKVGEESQGIYAQGNIYMETPKTMKTLLDGTEMSPNEVYVHELIHYIINTALENGSRAANEIRKLYEAAFSSSANSIVTFLPDGVDEATATKEQLSAAQERKDYIFGTGAANKIINRKDDLSGLKFTDETSNVLHEFAAFGATNANFIKALSTVKVRKSRRNPSTNWMERFKDWLQETVDSLTDNIFRTSGSTVDKKLLKLIEQLASVDARKKSTLNKAYDKSAEFTAKSINQLQRLIVAPAEKLAKSKIVRNSKYSPVRNMGRLIDVLPTVQVEPFIEATQKVGKRLGLAEEGMINSYLSETKGSTKGKVGTYDNSFIHNLVRLRSHLVDQTRLKVAGNYASHLLSQFRKIPNRLERAAITRGLIKTDMISLIDSNRYSWANIIGLLDDSSKINRRIKAVELELQNHYKTNHQWYTLMAENLGHFMAKKTALQEVTLLNAHNIAILVNTKLKPEGDLVRAENLIDELATLQSLKYTAKADKDLLAKVMRREFGLTANADINQLIQDGTTQINMDNGITFVLQAHRANKQRALDVSFKGQKALMQKGYTKDQYSPYAGWRVAPGDPETEKELARQGYTKNDATTKINKDPNDPNNDPMYFYITKDASPVAMMPGAMSFTSKKMAGTGLVDIHTQYGQSDPALSGYIDATLIAQAKAKEIDNISKGTPTKASTGDNMLIPVVDGTGKITAYRYMMSQATRDAVLQPNESFDEVLGHMESSIIDKHNSEYVNARVINETYDDYLNNYSKDPTSYIEISETSSNHLYREIYRMLPESARQEIKRVWGNNAMYVKAEYAKTIFGQRKYSITQWQKSNEPDAQGLRKLRNMTNDVVHGVVTTNTARRIESLWQETTAMVKDAIVIKSGTVLTGNLAYNTILLWAKGVPAKDAITGQARAISLGRQYQKDSRELDRLVREVTIIPSKQNDPEIRSRIQFLKNAIYKNPIRELMELGIHQSIVEDVDMINDQYSIKSRFEDALDRNAITRNVIGNTPETIKKGFKIATMQHDTAVYKFLRDATQVSDFAARFVLHENNMKNGMSKADSIDDIVESFVNYELPTHRYLQYGNDIGLVVFTKFFIRIQKIVFNAVRDNPGRSLASLGFSDLSGFLPPVTEPNMLTGSIASRVNLDPISFASKILSAPAISGSIID